MLRQRRFAGSGAASRAPFTGGSPRPRTLLQSAVVVAPIADAVRKPSFPFVRIAGQEEMKLAICLNVVDPNIGGVLIMGDRGTGKSVTVGNPVAPSATLSHSG